MGWILIMSLRIEKGRSVAFYQSGHNLTQQDKYRKLTVQCWHFKRLYKLGGLCTEGNTSRFCAPNLSITSPELKYPWLHWTQEINHVVFVYKSADPAGHFVLYIHLPCPRSMNGDHKRNQSREPRHSQNVAGKTSLSFSKRCSNRPQLQQHIEV